MASDQALNKPYAFAIILANGHEIGRQKLTLSQRNDVAKVFPQMYNSGKSGFNVSFAIPDSDKNAKLQLVLRFSDDSFGNGNVNDIWLTLMDNKPTIPNSPIKQTIMVSPEWVNTIRNYVHNHQNDYWDLEDISDEQTDKELTRIGKSLLAQNQYKHDPQLQDIQIHLNSDGVLDSKIQLEVTRYTADLLNQVRQALGEPKYMITEGSLERGYNLARDYSKDNYAALSKPFPHYMEALEKNGCLTESMSVGLLAGTLDGLHYNIYNAICSMLFDDGEGGANLMGGWGHMTDLTGIRGDTVDPDTSFNTYNTRGIYLSVQEDKMGQLHFNAENSTIKPDNYLGDDAKPVYVSMDYTQMVPLNDTDYDNFAIQNARQKLIKLVKDFNKKPYWDYAYSDNDNSKDAIAWRQDVTKIQAAQNELSQVYFNKVK